VNSDLTKLFFINCPIKVMVFRKGPGLRTPDDVSKLVQQKFQLHGKPPDPEVWFFVSTAYDLKDDLVDVFKLEGEAVAPIK
jgi:hypothetical protein